MAIGKRRQEQVELFVPTTSLNQGPGHPFYSKLNEVLAEAGFDAFLQKLCAPFHREGGRPGIPPRVYFRMVLIGYFEGIDSQRGIAWRCADSLSLRTFLGISITASTPVHASMSLIRKRLTTETFDYVFAFVLAILERKGLLRGLTLGIDATTLEANAAMKSIVRKDTGDDWKEYLRKLAADASSAPTVLRDRAKWSLVDQVVLPAAEAHWTDSRPISPTGGRFCYVIPQRYLTARAPIPNTHRSSLGKLRMIGWWWWLSCILS